MVKNNFSYDKIKFKKGCDNLDDILIIKEVLNGNKNEYSMLMNKYHNEIFKYVYNMVNNYQETEDLLQEIFFKVYKNLNKYNSDKASFRTWLYRISKNYVINYLKSAHNKINRNNLLYDDDINKSEENIETQAVQNDQIDRIIAVMEKVLKPKHQEIMQLYYFSNLTVKEISETMNIPDKTIYKAINSSIEKIKKEVDI